MSEEVGVVEKELEIPNTLCLTLYLLIDYPHNNKSSLPN